MNGTQRLIEKQANPFIRTWLNPYLKVGMHYYDLDILNSEKKSFLSRGTGETFTPPFHILKVAKIKQQCWLGPCNWRFFHKNC